MLVENGISFIFQILHQTLSSFFMFEFGIIGQLSMSAMLAVLLSGGFACHLFPAWMWARLAFNLEVTAFCLQFQVLYKISYCAIVC